MGKVVGLQFKEEVKAKTLDKMNREELVAIATEKGIEVLEKATKAEIVKLINSAEEPAQ